MTPKLRIGIITNGLGVPIPLNSLVTGQVVFLKNADGLLVKIIITKKAPP